MLSIDKGNISSTISNIDIDSESIGRNKIHTDMFDPIKSNSSTECASPVEPREKVKFIIVYKLYIDN